ncbi:VapE domain-containing protein [Prevotella sp. P6B4]|uniref:VapE domain-containing protein n=1 Tax=Prevotella sp. P6B4 TaxID=1410614 RepID=UPI0009DF17EC|nr:VapE domain-containing protein [Prevotella sp. P6B4]
MKVSLLQHSKDSQPQSVSLEQVVELIRTGSLVMPFCSVSAIIEGGYRPKNITSFTGLSVVSYAHLESSSVAELREEARADPHTLLLFGTADTLHIVFGYELERDYELHLQKLYYSKAYDFGCDYYDQLMGAKTDRSGKGRMVQLVHDAELCYHAYAEPFYAWEIKEANAAKREGRKSQVGVKERKQNWKEQYASVKDIREFLANHVYLRRNVITSRVEYRLPDNDMSWVPIDDHLVNSLWTKMSEQKTVRAPDIFRVIESDFVPDFNPFTSYLEHLPPWDEKNHILSLSLSVMVKGGVEKQELFYRFLRKWLVGVVAGWIDPVEVNHEILVLIGEQGSYKTTWFQYLLPPELRKYFYTKTNANRMSKDDLLTLAQYGLVCCEELDTMRQSELNQLKAAVTMQSIDERAAYAHFHEHRKHIASFCGTGNNVQFLNDPTGNRRWLPFEVESILNPREFEVDYEGVFAEAYALYQQGFCHWFTRSELELLGQHNEDFEAPMPEVEKISERFRTPQPGDQVEFVTRTMIFDAISYNPTLRLNINNIGPAMRKLGFEPARTKHGRGYWVYRYNDLEIKENKRKRMGMAVSDGDKGDNDDTVF